MSRLGGQRTLCLALVTTLLCGGRGNSEGAPGTAGSWQGAAMPGALSGGGALGLSRLESHWESQWLLALQEVGQPRA